MTTVSLDVTGRMLLGTDAAAVLAILEALHVDVIGFNCSTGPEHMREPIRYITSHTALPVACIPNAGLPINVDGRAHYPLQAVPMATELASFVTEYGVSVVGGCCGSTPEHIRELVARVGAASRAQVDAGSRAAPRKQHARDRPPSAAGAAAHRRAGQRPGIARDQAPAACRRLRRHPRYRTDAGRRWRTRARPVRRGHRAQR